MGNTFFYNSQKLILNLKRKQFPLYREFFFVLSRIVFFRLSVAIKRNQKILLTDLS